jgi:hypothetical protein
MISACHYDFLFKIDEAFHSGNSQHTCYDLNHMILLLGCYGFFFFLSSSHFSHGVGVEELVSFVFSSNFFFVASRSILLLLFNDLSYNAFYSKSVRIPFVYRLMTICFN